MGFPVDRCEAARYSPRGMDTLYLILQLVVALGLVVAALLGLAWYAGRRWALNRPVDETYFAQTEDGFRIALSRYRPDGEATGLPALLCHGLGANAFSLDLTEQRSLARYLRDRGRDAWLIELRGVGASVATGEWRKRTWCFDDFLTQDLPAAIARVLELTGAEALHWVGHSMGGMLGYAYLQGEGKKSVRSLTAIASPGSLDHMRRLRPLLRLLVNRRRPIRQIGLGRLGCWVAGLPVPGLSLLANPQNLEPHVRRQALANLPANIAGGLMAQIARWVIQGRIAPTLDGPDYDFTEEGLGRVDTPALLMAGTRDRLVPAASVEYAFNAIGSSDKKLVVVGPDDQDVYGYGHGDIALGDRAGEEVYPHVVAWLEGHD